MPQLSEFGHVGRVERTGVRAAHRSASCVGRDGTVLS